MNKLSALIPLKSKTIVYVPAVVSASQEINSAAYVERITRTLSACLGGATASPVRDYWISDSGEPIKEATVMVFACCSTADARKYTDDVISLCYELERGVGQEAIALEYSGEMYFI